MSVDISYYAFNEKRADEKWDILFDSNFKEIIKSNAPDPIGIRNTYLYHDIKDDVMSFDDFNTSLIYSDLEFGSVSAHLEEGDRENIFMYLLFSVFVPDFDASKIHMWEFPTAQVPQSQIIQLFENISYRKIEEAFDENPDNFASILGIPVEELSDWETIIKRFAQQVSPVAKDLKQNGSIFITNANDKVEKYPLFAKRAQLNLERILNTYPWIKEQYIKYENNNSRNNK